MWEDMCRPCDGFTDSQYMKHQPGLFLQTPAVLSCCDVTSDFHKPIYNRGRADFNRLSRPHNENLAQMGIRFRKGWLIS
ncbi:unnamed protein product [Tenebrio molitor]|nr:unnamed protein product [Tenebrio molitor]